MAETSLPAMPDGAMTAAPPVGGGQAPWRARLSGYLSDPAVKRALPALVAVGALAALAALYLLMAQGPQRILYSSLGDAERARVVETLEAGGIAYNINNATGALSVSEDDVYRARMLVASDAGLAAPEGASEMLDAIPLGSSRTLEGERLRLARERELMLTIREIDGIEAVRVHLATPERSVFVRESNPPSASVMVRLASGRSLGQSQVEAIVNLVSGSVPGMTSDTVRVVDQNGRLLSSPREDHHAGLVLQREFEAKLQEQLASLLTPLLGDGNFSSQVQVELDKDETTSAREVYDAEGAVRSESERSAVRMAGRGVGGIPGVTANTPPPEPELVDEPPAEGAMAPGADGGAGDREVATQRNYELGREVAVISSQPGGVVKLSVAVALDAAALEAASPLTAQQVQSLVSAAVGAQEARGDTVEVVVSAFEATEMEAPPFYELPWFAALMRIVAALIAVLLVLLIAVRPLLKRLNAKTGKADIAEAGTDEEKAALAEQRAPEESQAALEEESDGFTRKVELARQLASTQPDRAVEALQRMLEVPPANQDGQPAS